MLYSNDWEDNIHNIITLLLIPVFLGLSVNQFTSLNTKEALDKCEKKMDGCTNNLTSLTQKMLAIGLDPNNIQQYFDQARENNRKRGSENLKLFKESFVEKIKEDLKGDIQLNKKNTEYTLLLKQTFSEFYDTMLADFDDRMQFLLQQYPEVFTSEVINESQKIKNGKTEDLVIESEFGTNDFMVRYVRISSNMEVVIRRYSGHTYKGKLKDPLRFFIFIQRPNLGAIMAIDALANESNFSICTDPTLIDGTKKDCLEIPTTPTLTTEFRDKISFSMDGMFRYLAKQIEISRNPKQNIQENGAGKGSA